MTIQEKLDKEKKKLESLLEQRKELDEKIQKVQGNVNKYDAMIKQKAYKETDEILLANNLTLEMINEAIKSGDLTSLQLMVDEARAKKEVESTNDEADTLGA